MYLFAGQVIFFSKEAFVTCNARKESKVIGFTIIEMIKSISSEGSGTVRDRLQILLLTMSELKHIN